MKKLYVSCMLIGICAIEASWPNVAFAGFEMRQANGEAILGTLLPNRNGLVIFTDCDGKHYEITGQNFQWTTKECSRGPLISYKRRTDVNLGNGTSPGSQPRQPGSIFRSQKPDFMDFYKVDEKTNTLIEDEDKWDTYSKGLEYKKGYLDWEKNQITIKRPNSMIYNNLGNQIGKGGEGLNLNSLKENRR